MLNPIFFRKAPNFGVDPELAVATGAAVQAGVIGGGWPLQISAMELPFAKSICNLLSNQVNPIFSNQVLIYGLRFVFIQI